MPEVNLTLLKSVLSNHGVKPLKRLGQNFLIDNNILRKIVAASGIDKQSEALEIGPGAGSLTWHLCRAAKKVVCVELDAGMEAVLGETLADCDNWDLINGDILKLDLGELFAKFDGPAYVVANLPYYITTPVILKLLHSDLPLKSMTFLVQSEVAQRMSAKPGEANYGSLSVAVQFYADVEIAAKVSRNCFYPMPDVQSSVVCLSFRSGPPIECLDTERFFLVARSAFAQRRKTMQNNLCAVFGIDKKAAEEVLAAADIPPMTRGEALSMQSIERIARALPEKVFANKK